MLLRAAAFTALGAVSPLLTYAIARLTGAPFIDGVTFGFVLAVYLRVCRGVHVTGRLASLVAISAGAFWLAVFASIPFQPGPTAFLLSGALGASVVSTAFLLLVPDRSLSLRTLAHIKISTAAGAFLGLLGYYASKSGDFVWLVVIWQAGMALTLTVIAELPAAASDTAAPVPAANRTAPLPSTSFGVVAVMVALTVVGFSWMAVRQIQGRRYLARWEQQNAEFVAAAPSRENLPPLSVLPLGDVFVARVDGLRLMGNGNVQPQSSERTPVPGHAAPPPHLLYFGSYEDSTASIAIWQYPTADWARYEARHFLSGSERGVGTRRVLTSALESWWYSGTRVIRVSGQPGEQDALLGVYLERYPSDVEESFPLFSSLRAQIR